MKKLISRRNFLKGLRSGGFYAAAVLPVAAANPPAAAIILPQLWT